MTRNGRRLLLSLATTSNCGQQHIRRAVRTRFLAVMKRNAAILALIVMQLCDMGIQPVLAGQTENAAAPIHYDGGPVLPKMSVFAGSGKSGITDGPSADAEFVFPTAIAGDASGNIYVADTGAQRIRMIAPNGNVSTVAGSGMLESSRLWVQPGYRDGPALSAQFNRPSGLAVGTSGEVYVADSFNHCIRSIKDHAVSTFAGSCGTTGVKDGPRAQALFSYPRQIALAPNGDLYVADFPNAVRRIDASGNVTTLSVTTDKRITGVAISRGTLFVADPTGITRVDLASGKAAGGFPEYYTERKFPPPIAGGLELGSPYALATNADFDGIFYTDLDADTVRRITAGDFMQYISDVPREDAPLGIAYPTSALSLHGPMGITFDTSGNLLVADSGHKRIMRVQGVNKSPGYVAGPAALLTLPPKGDNEFRILIVGNSYVYFTADERTSIGAHVEQDLLRSGRTMHAVPRVFSLIATAGIDGQASLAKEIIAETNIDLVIIFANSFDMYHHSEPDFRERFHKTQADTVASLKAASIQSIFVTVPGTLEGSPYEQLYYLHEISEFQSDYWQSANIIPQVGVQLHGIGVPILDMTQYIRDYEASAHVEPIYHNYDSHPNPFGRQFVAEHISACLLKMQPWKRSPAAVPENLCSSLQIDDTNVSAHEPLRN